MTGIDDSVLFRWMKLEMRRINDGIVAERRSLAALLAMDPPVATTREGKEYRFSTDILRELAQKLPEALHESLKLPILFYYDMQVPASCILTDPVALEALIILGEVSGMRRMRDGKLWLAKPIVYAIKEHYPSAVQIMMR
ncbi:MAG: DUF61 family protein [Methanomicrobiaceae archaeon]|nr:DUF61 family protein [Methanomicrobiaceae archaeon]